MHNFNKYKQITGTYGKQHCENNKKLLTQVLYFLPDHCCYFTLQNEMLAILL